MSAVVRTPSATRRLLSPRERRWAVLAAETIFPRVEGAPGTLPSGGEVDPAGFLDEFLGRAPFQMRFAARLALWVFTLAPLIVVGRPRLATGLDRESRERYVNAWLSHRFYLLRQLGFVLKLLLSLAYFHDVRVQVALGLPGA